MNFEFAMSAELSKATVEAMVKAAVEAQTGQQVASVDFKIHELGVERFGKGFHAFSGATVRFATGLSNVPTGPLKR